MLTICQQQQFVYEKTLPDSIIQNYVEEPKISGPMNNAMIQAESLAILSVAKVIGSVQKNVQPLNKIMYSSWTRPF